ncbi:hypothetical protein L227DRAFT_123328 [Lentinus tigrinus ALCF2SS1-6]|uniref:EF-hand n=1 Tax=Lentinus tigrinus ALCF2SS1-6 TaxID=1328759 RepID=A0A5C2SPS3_9APHY|nr:hypothetical protein L227DRAFT_123328 [Lentinus tigrinus ALCF2SS1-6]
MSKFTPTPAEVALINQIFAQADTQKLGVITGEAAVNIFSGSKLSPTVLAEIWNIADEDNNGVLTRKGVGIAIRLLGHAQRGEKVSEALVTQPGPIPNIEGLPPVSVPSSMGIPRAKSPSGLPPLTPADKTKFLKLFLGCHPTNGILSGDKARDVFVKSKLPVDKLSAIWALADTKNRGVLDATDFTIAMYLIQASMSGQLQTIPSTLPPSVYEQASNGIVPQATGGSGHMSPSLTGGFPGHVVQPQYTGQALSQLQSQMTGQGLSSIQPQMTGQLRSTPSAPPLPARSALSSSGVVSSPAFPFVQQQTTGAQWDVTPQEKASSDRIFDSLDAQKRGYIEGDIAVPFMLQSKLPEDVLAQVWDLSDLNNDGRLTRDGFAVAMHLIQGKLAGREIPASLPASLIPPSMRGSVGASQPPAQPAVPEAIKDLLWDDSPPASATVPTHAQSILQPQSTGISTMSGGARPTPTMSPPPRAVPPAVSDPFSNSPFGISIAPAPHKDLLGDDDEPHAASPPLQDQSAEIGNVKNQLNSTNRSLEAAKAERENVERQLTEQAALLSSLQTQLSSAKAAYDTETKLLGTLKDRFAGQSAEIQKTREDLIHAESDLSAAKVEKAEVEGAFLRDKEEVRDLHRKMHEVGAQIEATKAELEKLKKEAKQQKGLLAIAKKQLATRETEKAKVDKEMEEAKAELQEITKEREAAEVELSKEEAPTTLTNGHVSPSPISDSSVVFAAAQPLPASIPTSPDVSPPASIISKSTNPFERLAMSGSPRPESPFLPFAATSALPTPPVASAAQEAAPEDPFGFNEAFSAPEEPKVEAPEPETPKPAHAIPAPLSIGSPKAQSIISPAETDLFTTPPTTATGSEHVITPPRATQFPALVNVVSEDRAPTPTSAPPTATPQNPQAHEEDTDLTHELKEIEESDSESDSSDDDEPLTAVKAKLTDHAEAKTNGTAPAEAPGTSTFDDSFGVTSTKTEEPSKEAGQPAPIVSSPTSTANDVSTMFETPAVGKEAPPAASIPATVEAPKPNDSAMAPSAGVSEFDQALGKIANQDTSAPPSGFTDFGFDSAFDDNFDFAAASAAQPTQPAVDASPSTSAFPPAPTAATTKATSFDDVFGTSALPNAASAVSPPVQAAAVPSFPPVSAPVQSPPQPQHQLSFDDAFGAGPSRPAQNLAASTSTTTNGTVSGFSFDDAFGGNDEALALDNSFTSQSSTQYQPPPGPPPTKAAQQPFPASSPAASPRGSSSTQGGRPSSPTNRHASPPPRHASPPPRHSSPTPRPRPSTSESKEKAAATRHNRLSIRLPFGRKKKHHDAPPVPALAQQQIVEDPTPAVEDDVEAVKTLCGMGFSRTQAVSALEEHGYDVQRALNSLLGSQ